MALPEYSYVDVEDYLALDNTAQSVRYEYIDGTLKMQAGGSPDHSIIAANLIGFLTSALRKKPCIVYNSDVRFRLSEFRYLHPDITISCDPRDRDRKDDIQYPRLIVEVLSSGTERIDTGEKLNLYRECPSIEKYLLIDSQRKFAELYLHNSDTDTWTSRIYKSGSIIHLQCIGQEIPLDDIYEKTSLE